MAVNVVNTADNTLVSGTSGKDTIQNSWYEKVKIFGGSGEDIISNRYGIHVTMNGGAGNDSITNGGSDVKILGGAGNDSIESSDSNRTTINGGKGNDLIHIEYVGTREASADNSVIQYAKGDGNDTVFGFKSDDTLYITKGSYSTTKSGSDFIVRVGNSKIILKDALADSYNKITIKDSSGNISVYNDWEIRYGSVNENYAGNVTLGGSQKSDTIKNYADDVLITAGAGNDYIDNYGSNVIISGGAGNDSISCNTNSENTTVDGGIGDDYFYNFYGVNINITGGKGNDTINNNGTSSKIDCGIGSDYVTGYGSQATIKGGKGTDTIVLAHLGLGVYAKNDVVQYAEGDGNDIIIGFNSDDTLHITKGSYKVKTSGSDIIVTVGKGKITLKDAADSSISIKDSSGKDTTKNFSSNIAELFAEDNLSEIVAEKSVAEFENSAERFTQENLITFAE